MKIRNIIIRTGVAVFFLLMTPLSQAAPTAMSIALSSLVSAATMTSYCQVPPMKQALSPNIMFGIDVSGSMGYLAYKYGSPLPTYNSNLQYEGYFDPAKNYAFTYLASDGVNTSNVYSVGSTTMYYDEEAITGVPCAKGACEVWKCNTTNTGGCDAKGTHTCSSSQYACCTSWQTTGDCGNPKSGNQLNFENMHRIDLLRWALTGGTPATNDSNLFCGDTGKKDGTYCNPQQYNSTLGSARVGKYCNPTFGCILSFNPLATTDSYKYKVKVPWSRVMDALAFQMQALPVVPRMGALFFSNTGIDPEGKTYLGDFTTSGATNTAYVYNNILSAVNYIAANGNTPTGPAMWDIFNYYAQKAPQHSGIVPQTTTDTWRNPMYVCKDTTGTNCKYIPCVDNFVILMSDGEWNTPSDNISSSGTTINTNDSDPVVPAYLMHKDFLNTKTSVTTRVRDVYTVSLFQSAATAVPSGRLALKNTAMYGSFATTTTGWPGGTSNFPQTTCGGSSGSLCTSLPTSTITNRQTSWDADGDGVPDTYSGGDSADEIKDSVYAAVLEILSHTAAGTAASVLASREGSGANLMQAVYYPKKSYTNGVVDWVGNLQNLWYYIDPALVNSTIREDGRDADGVTHDKILNLKTGVTAQNDYVATFSFDPGLQAAVATRWTDTNGDGSIAGESQLADIKVDAVANIWEAGALLWSKNWYDRNLITTTTGNSNLTFSCTSAGTCAKAADGTLTPYLNAASNAEASTIMQWVLGKDNPTSGAFTPNYRTRAAEITTTTSTTKVWKLGDIINSTPKISTWKPLNDYHIAYKAFETTYAPPGSVVFQSDPVSTGYYATGYQYKGRGMVYAGGNDGMLHAFRLGLLQSVWTGQTNFQKARLTNKVCSVTKSIYCDVNSNCPGLETCSASVTPPITLGDEVWAFIPKNVLPYLKYLTSTDYCHLYTVDLSPMIFDASIGDPATRTSTYYDDLKTVASWRTVLIGGMRFGGACRTPGAVCTDCIKTPTADPNIPAKGLGYSSYFALDITDQDNPKVMWEYDGTVKSGATYNNSLGLSFSGPAVARINHVTGSIDATKAAQNNGKWLVTFGSGPTGPIDTLNQQLMGRSDQNLTIHVFDLATGPGTDNSNVFINDTGKANAFSGAITNTTYDVDLDYSDDVIYIPYTTGTSTTDFSGGLGRLVTYGEIDPSKWVWSDVITDTGPITASPDMTTDPRTGDIWLFFGTGRYFFDTVTSLDDPDPVKRRQIFGMKERCLKTDKQGFDPSCTDVAIFNCATPSTAIDCGDLKNVDVISVAANLEATKASTKDPYYKGWYIDLDPALLSGSPPYYAERVITNPTVDSTGIVYYTTFKPENNSCSKDGQTNIWAVKFDTGGAAAGLIVGKAIIQVSTGSIEQVDLSSAFTNKDGRRTAGFKGKPPAGEGLTVMPGVAGISKPMFMKER